MSNPSIEHYNYLNNIFSYLVSTRNYGLDLTLYKQSTANTINNNKIINLEGISDAD
jgi:hypothetical protein